MYIYISSHADHIVLIGLKSKSPKVDLLFRSSQQVSGCFFILRLNTSFPKLRPGPAPVPRLQSTQKCGAFEGFYVGNRHSGFGEIP